MVHQDTENGDISVSGGLGIQSAKLLSRHPGVWVLYRQKD